MDQPSGQSGSTMVTVLGFLEILLICAASYFLSQVVGSKDSANDLVKTVLPVIGTLGGIVLVHTGLWYMYFTYNPLGMNLYFLMATSMSIIISLTALAIAMVNKS